MEGFAARGCCHNRATRGSGIYYDKPGTFSVIAKVKPICDVDSANISDAEPSCHRGDRQSYPLTNATICVEYLDNIVFLEVADHSVDHNRRAAAQQ